MKTVTRNTWEKHLCLALVLASVAFAVGELQNAFWGAAVAAVAFFVTMRPLFRGGAGSADPLPS